MSTTTPAELTPGQLNSFAITERITSIFSLLGIFFILSTFLLARGFNKPINRLVFAASWSNLGMNIASLIAQDGVSAGADSSLCQFQAFAIQMFLGVDALWALAMALNVYLALFRGWTAQRMQAQEWKYFVGAYGLSFIPAITYLFLKDESRHRVYGPALLWCWIQSEWDFLRMATLYAIVWVALISAFAIYCLAFRKVWRNRHTLRPLFNPFNENPFGTITTEITVQSESRQPRSSSPASQYPLNNNEDEEMRIPGLEGYHNANNTGFDPYTVNVEVGPQSKSHQDDRKLSHTMAPELFRVRTLTRDHALAEANADAWLYARVAFLFFCALLISWVPSSINRVYSLAHPTKILYGLNYTETLVLPLQGFFNALVYIITSQTACRNLWRGMWGKGELPMRNPSMSGGGVNGGPPEYGMGMGMGMGKGDNLKMERFTARRTSQRLESDVTSISSLRPH